MTRLVRGRKRLEKGGGQERAVLTAAAPGRRPSVLYLLPTSFSRPRLCFSLMDEEEHHVPSEVRREKGLSSSAKLRWLRRVSRSASSLHSAATQGTKESGMSSCTDCTHWAMAAAGRPASAPPRSRACRSRRRLPGRVRPHSGACSRLRVAAAASAFRASALPCLRSALPEALHPTLAGGDADHRRSVLPTAKPWSLSDRNRHVGPNPDPPAALLPAGPARPSRDSVKDAVWAGPELMTSKRGATEARRKIGTGNTVTRGFPLLAGGGAMRPVGGAEWAGSAPFGQVLRLVLGKAVKVMAVLAGLTFLVSLKISSGCSKQLM